ncbi:Gfo/Idh/MocA family protein [Caldalkalibacillus mannanilyticus]|uniref:Gfo/Idh/MocA family protein n=1 Tax=Caldalkalibacillus mannanilyticus TaxID=1418 RepID=UPI0004688E5F|nr:NAD(P)-dependent oxidoreductase [Caldalkalibacillus mannanilyticus]
MNCIVVGYGSIGQRHVRLLRKLGCHVAVVSKRSIPFDLTYSSLTEAIEREKPHYIILANATDEHYLTFAALTKSDYKGIVLIEKPLFHLPLVTPIHQFEQVYIGYNLRFHPMMREIYDLVQKEKNISAQVYVGQFLPEWRLDRDYRQSYSAKKDRGGGVLLDLSHELDYLQWFYGDWNRIASIGGKYSSLEIDSDDNYSLLIEMKDCPSVQLQVNYLDRIHRREINILTENYSLRADLVQQTLQINHEIRTYHLTRDDTYLLQHQAILEGKVDHACTLKEGCQILEMVTAIEMSNKQRKWIEK